MSKLEDLARAEADRRYRINYAIPMPNELAASNGFMAGAKWAVSRVTEEQIAEVLDRAMDEWQYAFDSRFATPEDPGPLPAYLAERVTALYRAEDLNGEA